MWSRPVLRKQDYDVYHAYAAYSQLRVHGVFRHAMDTLLETENLEYVDGEIVTKTETIS